MKKLLLATFLMFSLVGCKDLGDGQKVGQIVRLAKHGFFCKTWEATILRGGLSNGSGAMGTAFDFTIEDPSLVPAVQAALDGQYEVEIHYNREATTFCRSESGDDFLNWIKRLR